MASREKRKRSQPPDWEEGNEEEGREVEVERMHEDMKKQESCLSKPKVWKIAGSIGSPWGKAQSCVPSADTSESIHSCLHRSFVDVDPPRTTCNPQPTHPLVLLLRTSVSLHVTDALVPILSITWVDALLALATLAGRPMETHTGCSMDQST